MQVALDISKYALDVDIWRWAGLHHDCKLDRASCHYVVPHRHTLGSYSAHHDDMIGPGPSLIESVASCMQTTIVVYLQDSFLSAVGLGPLCIAHHSQKSSSRDCTSPSHIQQVS